MPDHTLRLNDVPPGTFVCQGIDEDGTNPVRMKSLGICHGREIELVSCGDPMIVRVAGAQIGLSRVLAASVSITAPARPTPEKKAK